MKAARIVPSATGGLVEVLEVATPQPGDSQVLVRVMASSVNRGEVLQASRFTSGDHLPIGVEFAGMVESVGAGVTQWQPGDRVMGHGNGGQAEYVVSSQHTLAEVPAGVSWVSAAAFPNVYMTAHDALITNGRMAPGETVLVNAASSGIGIAAIQIARVLGAGTIIATTRSSAKTAKLLELGVDVVIDTSTTDQVEAVMAATDNRGADVVIDSVGGTVFEANLDSMAIEGRLVNIGRLGSATSTIDLTTLWRKRLQLIGVTFQTRSEEQRVACFQASVSDLAKPFAEGLIVPVIDSTYPLAEIMAAHAYMSEDKHFGKIVLTVDDAALDQASGRS
ncbi:zinc-binding dehydrogenase [Nocardioides sp. Soil796]|uniref:zinc-binding dehydrogenase n=1 Tax=Nocardioides sp. Soil796 TaxID=1736412 RepID=UPI00070D69A1|nr:zinc-binding dehydrogenase [Nocardioides sp. Soil796]KRF10388.1 acryloyl-CoA reductase [Nocardioides sp. Soil796]